MLRGRLCHQRIIQFVALAHRHRLTPMPAAMRIQRSKLFSVPSLISLGMGHVGERSSDSRSTLSLASYPDRRSAG